MLRLRPRALQRLTCPLCHDDLEQRPCLRTCPRCNTAHHLACWQELGGCAVLGCRRGRVPRRRGVVRRIIRPRLPRRLRLPRRVSPRLRRGLLIAGVVVAALVGLSFTELGRGTFEWFWWLFIMQTPLSF